MRFSAKLRHGSSRSPGTAFGAPSIGDADPERRIRAKANGKAKWVGESDGESLMSGAAKRGKRNGNGGD